MAGAEKSAFFFSSLFSFQVRVRGEGSKLVGVDARLGKETDEVARSHPSYIPNIPHFRSRIAVERDVRC